jgi:hypothetical protein
LAAIDSLDADRSHCLLRLWETTQQNRQLEVDFT